ncbi:hypothetical protein Bbelb_260960 [Branchiostoma belcheri]|nr:hypothetical protein Bbelb_260960 [Branchiostoma belcheri]
MPEIPPPEPLSSLLPPTVQPAPHFCGIQAKVTNIEHQVLAWPTNRGKNMSVYQASSRSLAEAKENRLIMTHAHEDRMLDGSIGGGYGGQRSNSRSPRFPVPAMKTVLVVACCVLLLAGQGMACGKGIELGPKAQCEKRRECEMARICQDIQGHDECLWKPVCKTRLSCKGAPRPPIPFSNFITKTLEGARFY